MKTLFEKVLALAGRHMPELSALFLSILFFLVVSGVFIEEKSVIEKFFATGVGFFVGLVGGSVIGWIVGGIGIALMGTAVGIGSLGVIVIGGLAGAAFGAITGTGFTFFQMIRNPSAFDVNWFALLGVLLATAVVFLILKHLFNWMVRHVPALTKRFLVQSE